MAATREVLAGGSLGAVTKRWNAEGFTTSTGRRWVYASLRQVLTRARNAGLIELNGEIVGRSTWPAIVSEDEWRGVCALLLDPARRRSQSNRARHLLAGIAVCGAEGCGLPMRSASAISAGKKRTVYRCRAGGGGHAARAADPVDELVDGVICARLARGDLGDLLPADERPDVAEARSTVVALRGRLAEYQTNAANMDPADYAAATRAVRDRIAEVEQTLTAGARSSALESLASAEDPAAAWSAASIERKRAIIRLLVTVTIRPVPKGRACVTFHPNWYRLNGGHRERRPRELLSGTHLLRPPVAPREGSGKATARARRGLPPATWRGVGGRLVCGGHS